jgi:hypothetical protein
VFVRAISGIHAVIVALLLVLGRIAVLVIEGLAIAVLAIEGLASANFDVRELVGQNALPDRNSRRTVRTIITMSIRIDHFSM